MCVPKGQWFISFYNRFSAQCDVVWRAILVGYVLLRIDPFLSVLLLSFISQYYTMPRLCPTLHFDVVVALDYLRLPACAKLYMLIRCCGTFFT